MDFKEDFISLLDKEPYVRYCWSFGNNGRSYMYSKAVEPYKKALHNAVVFGDFAELRRLCPLVSDAAERALAGLSSRKERRVEIGRAIVRRLKVAATMEDIKENPLYGQVRLKAGGVLRLQSLGSLESLERLERLQRLNMDYRDVPLPDGCVVYCDPPYAGTNGYGLHKSAFDHDAFWDWARRCEVPLFVSEYTAPKDFVPIAEFPHRSRLSATANNSVTERLFVHESRYDEMETRLI